MEVEPEQQPVGLDIDDSGWCCVFMRAGELINDDCNARVTSQSLAICTRASVGAVS